MDMRHGLHVVVALFLFPEVRVACMRKEWKHIGVRRQSQKFELENTNSVIVKVTKDMDGR